MKRYYYTDRFKTDGKTLGPVSIEELEQLYIKQEITEKCLVCGVGASNWEPFLNVLATHNKTKRIQKSSSNSISDSLSNIKLPKSSLVFFAIGLFCLINALAHSAFIIPTIVFFALGAICFFIPSMLGEKGGKIDITIFRIFKITGIAIVVTFTLLFGKFLLNEDKEERARANYQEQQKWDNRNVIAVEKEVIESKIKPSIGVVGGKKPRVGAVLSSEKGSTKYKVTYEDDDGIIRTETLNKDPTKD